MTSPRTLEDMVKSRHHGAPGSVLSVDWPRGAEGGVRGNILRNCPEHLKSTIAEAELSLSQLEEAVQLLSNYQDVFVGTNCSSGR